MNSSEMIFKPGVVALIDALGFKGIWRRAADPTRLLQTLISWSQETQLHVQDLGEASGNWFYKNGTPPIIRFLSDTIFIGLHAEPGDVQWIEDDAPERSRQALAVRTVAGSAVNIIRKALTINHPILYRGCLTFGDFAAAENFILGPAVDEAAELFELAEGAFTFLAPSALRLYEEQNPWKAEDDPMLVPYALPLKRGTTFHTQILNPLPWNEKDQFIASVKASFRPGNSNLDVLIKEQHTEAFLRHCQKRFSKGHLSA